MKSIGKFSQLIACTVALMIAAVAAHAADTVSGSAVVVSVKGTVNFSENGGAQMPLVTGISLKAGAIITTGKNSSAELNLGDNGQMITIKSDSTLAITKLNLTSGGAEPVADTELNLKSGSVGGNVKKISAASQFNVKFAKGVAGIRGTGWAIEGNNVVCNEGSVQVTFIVGGVASTMTISAGQTVEPPTTPGGKPTVRAATSAELAVVPTTTTGGPTPTPTPGPVITIPPSANPPSPT